MKEFKSGMNIWLTGRSNIIFKIKFILSCKRLIKVLLHFESYITPPLNVSSSYCSTRFFVQLWINQIQHY